MGNSKNRATCFATLPQNELNTEPSCVFYQSRKKTSQLYLLQDRFDVGGKTHNGAIQLVLQQCGKTSFTFLFSVLL